MSDLIKTLRQEALQENEDYVEIDYRTEAANLIEQQQRWIAKLEQRNNELAATVERLREVVYSERKSLMVRVDAEKIIQAIPSQNLNAVKLNALLDFRHDCGSMNGYNSVDVWDKMDEYIKREFG